MLSPASTRSKGGASLVQSIYMDDNEISMPRFAENLECVGKSFRNTVTPQSNTPMIHSNQNHYQDHLGKNISKKRQV